MQKRKTLALAGVLGVTMQFACVPTPNAMPQPQADEKHTVSLQSHRWIMDSAATHTGEPDGQWQLPAISVQPARNIALHFEGTQSLSVQRLCNTMHGRYTVNGQHIKIDQVNSTLMACRQPELMDLERKVRQQLPTIRTWEIVPATAPVLALTFDNGSVWHFKGTPTLETLYGQSQKIFLEVGAHKVTCSSPNMHQAQCLEVREIKYDNAAQHAATPWQHFYGHIEGYTHQPGVRNVLRIKRYERPTPPAGISPYIYALDMTIESEIAR